MTLSKKLQKLVDQKLITLEQAQKIMATEQNKHTTFIWQLMYALAGFLIGAGALLLVGSNWDSITPSAKLTGNFAIWMCVLYGLYRAVAEHKKTQQELFLMLSFLGIAVTIGLVGQLFNLNGSWDTFSLVWGILGLVYVLPSNLMVLNVFWLLIMLSHIWDLMYLDYWQYVWLYMFEHNPEGLFIAVILLLSLLVYAGNQLYLAAREKILLPKAFAALCRFEMYMIVVTTVLICNISHTYISEYMHPWRMNTLVFLFLGARLGLAVFYKDIKSFVRNCILLEFVVVYIFLTAYYDLFSRGMGLIIGGFLVLGVLYSVKNTSKYIKKLEMFHE